MTADALAPAADNEIRIIRVYDAPVSLVWDAWTDLAHVSKWWGPRGFTITTKAKELRAGGFWDYTMHGPDGKDWPNYARYHEVVPQKLLAYDHGATSADAAPLFRVRAEFSEHQGRTTLVMSMMFDNAEAAQNSRVFIKAAGGNSTWDRLAEYLEAEQTKKEVFVINRSFKAPIETMFELWSNPAQLAKWVPPTGFTMEYRNADIRAGGESSYAMTNGQFTMYGRANYLEIRRPDRLVYTQCFTDAEGNLSRHPAAPTWPATMLTTVTLASEGPAETRVTLQWEPYGEATAEEVATFAGAKAGMTGGWTGSFDKLDEEIAAMA